MVVGTGRGEGAGPWLAIVVMDFSRIALASGVMETSSLLAFMYAVHSHNRLSGAPAIQCSEAEMHRAEWGQSQNGFRGEEEEEEPRLRLCLPGQLGLAQAAPLWILSTGSA